MTNSKDDAILHPLWKDEFFDIIKVLDMGAKKYSPDGWLEADGKRATYREYHDSAFHHLAKSLAGFREDEESGIDHLLHAAINCLMLYTRLQRGLRHPEDKLTPVDRLFITSKNVSRK